MEILIFLVIIFGMLGVITSVRFYFLYNDVKKSHHWQSVNGKILSSEVNQEREFTGHTKGTQINWKTRTKFYPKIKYSYIVAERNYQSERITLGAHPRIRGTIMAIISSISPNSKLEWAQKIVDNYPLGADVRVFYDPNSPKEAILEPGGQNFGVFFSGLIAAWPWLVVLVLLLFLFIS